MKPSPAVIRYAAQTSTGLPTSPMTQGSANAIRLTAERRPCTVNDHFRLAAIPPKAHEHEVNARTPLEWVIDRCRISRDRQGGIPNDPNARFDDPRDPIAAPPPNRPHQRRDEPYRPQAFPVRSPTPRGHLAESIGEPRAHCRHGRSGRVRNARVQEHDGRTPRGRKDRLRHAQPGRRSCAVRRPAGRESGRAARERAHHRASDGRARENRSARLSGRRTDEGS